MRVSFLQIKSTFNFFLKEIHLVVTIFHTYYAMCFKFNNDAEHATNNSIFLSLLFFIGV